MFRSIVILLLTLLLVSCAGKPDFDVRKQIPAVKNLTTILPPDGEAVVIAVYAVSYTHLTLPTTPYV